MRIAVKTTLCLVSLLLVGGPAAFAQDEGAQDEGAQDEGAQDEGAAGVHADVVKGVRAILSAKKASERDEMLEQLLKGGNLDWPSIQKGLTEGPYYQKPLVTEYGERHSGRNLGIRLTGEDGKERGFSYYVPESYDPAQKIPVLVYLHHGSYMEPMGTERAGTAMFKFRKDCERHGVMFVAPYTARGGEWWMPEGRRLVEWTLDQLKQRYSLDEDRIALMGAQDGGEGAWALAQELPGTFSAILPMTSDPYEITGMIRPLFLGTLDRMDVLLGVPGLSKGALGEKNIQQYLDSLDPMFRKNMRITAAIFPTAQADFRYLEDIQDMVLAFTKDKKRKPLADEVDLETDAADGLRGLWLENHGVDPEGEVAGNFPTTLLEWKAPERDKADKKLGLALHDPTGWEIGLMVQRATGEAMAARIEGGDILLEVAHSPIREMKDVKQAVQQYDWGTWVPVLLAREVKESDLEREQGKQAHYMRYRKRLLELEANGEEVPRNLWESLAGTEDDGEEEEEEDDGESTIEISEPGEESGGEDKPGGRRPGAGEEEATVVYVFERWVRLSRPESVFVREDFGARPDPAHRETGVRIGGVVPGGRAWRAGLRDGDVIKAVVDNPVETTRDMASFFDSYDFEKAPAGQRTVVFTVDRGGSEHQCTASWEPVVGGRVDARWDKTDDTLHVLARRVKGFTVYFTDELIAPGKEFRLYINEVPWQDLVDPASMPDYPKIGPNTPGVVRDDFERMKRKRAVVEGWQPDYRWAIEEGLRTRDRSLVLGGKMSVDLRTLAPGFAKWKERTKREESNRGDKVKKAYEEYQAEAGGQER